jgi:hypothetical protein
VRRDLLLIVAYLAAFGILTAALAAGGPLIDLDLAVREWSEAHRPPVADLAARGLNLLGQGGALLAVSAGLATLLALRLRSVIPLLYVVAAAVLIVPTVVLLKGLTERGAPSSPLPPEQTVALMGPLPPGEYAAGYPGGHATNAILWYAVILTLVTALLCAYGRAVPSVTVRPVVRTAPPVIVVAASTYLSWHWFTDGFAGVALGLALERTLHLVPWRMGVARRPAESGGRPKS